MCGPRKYTYPPQGQLLEIPGARAASKVNFFKVEYEPKLEFPEGTTYLYDLFNF